MTVATDFHRTSPASKPTLNEPLILKNNTENGFIQFPIIIPLFAGGVNENLPPCDKF